MHGSVFENNRNQLARPRVFGILSVALVLFLTQQVYLRDYNVVMNCLVLVMFLVLCFEKIPTLTWVLCLILMVNFVVSALTLNNVFYSVRFFFVIIATVFAFQVKETSPPLRIILGVGGLQAFLVIFIGLYLMISGDERLACWVRVFFKDYGLGDVYTFNGVYYRVQLVGNALIPFFFMISYERRAESYIYIFFSFLYFTAVIFCGNLTFFIACFIYVFICLDRYRKKCLVIFFAFLSPVLLNSLHDIWAMKFSGGASSMGIRFDQAIAILNKLHEKPIAFFTGWGLGAPMPDGVYKKYSSSLYIEIQSLYIFFQIGLLGFAFYCVNVIYLVKKTFTPRNTFIFIMYLIYASSNPYMFDTTHFIVVLLLTMLSNTDRIKMNVVHLSERMSIGGAGGD